MKTGGSVNEMQSGNRIYALCRVGVISNPFINRLISIVFIKTPFPVHNPFLT